VTRRKCSCLPACHIRRTFARLQPGGRDRETNLSGVTSRDQAASEFAIRDADAHDLPRASCRNVRGACDCDVARRKLAASRRVIDDVDGQPDHPNGNAHLRGARSRQLCAIVLRSTIQNIGFEAICNAADDASSGSSCQPISLGGGLMIIWRGGESRDGQEVRLATLSRLLLIKVKYGAQSCLVGIYAFVSTSRPARRAPEQRAIHRPPSTALSILADG